MSTTSRLAAAGLLLATTAPLLAATTSPAAALSCVGRARAVADASWLLTGRVLDTEDGAFVVQVEEVRRGEPADGTVELVVDQAFWGPWPNDGEQVSDGWASAGSWLFAPYEADGAWRVNPCTAWPADGTAPDAAPDATPASAAAPVPDEDPVSRSALLGAGAVLAGAVGLVGLVATRLARRRSARA